MKEWNTKRRNLSTNHFIDFEKKSIIRSQIISESFSDYEKLFRTADGGTRIDLEWKKFWRQWKNEINKWIDEKKEDKDKFLQPSQNEKSPPSGGIWLESEW